jgi:NAD(P)-dependent dehydrogenase (short-subunit alcohol dehydrogenase family)
MKNILITGASGNLGKATVEKFLAEGFNVIAIVSPGKTLGYEVSKPVGIYEADLMDEKAVESVISKILADHKSIYGAVLTVGGFAMGPLESTDGAALQKMFTLNFNTAFFTARPIFKHMLSRQTGRIILVGARPALMADEGKGVVAYALSKSLIFKLSELLNAEGKSKNVLSSVVVPSIIDTPANRQAMPNADFSKWLSPEKIAAIIYDLISDEGKALREPVVKLF